MENLPVLIEFEIQVGGGVMPVSFLHASRLKYAHSFEDCGIRTSDWFPFQQVCSPAAGLNRREKCFFPGARADGDACKRGFRIKQGRSKNAASAANSLF